jgi:hypothetical protein
MVEFTKDGNWEETEWHDTGPGVRRLWGSRVREDGILLTFKFSKGLIVAWFPMEVGDQKETSASMEFEELPGYEFEVELTVDVLGKETLTLSFDTFEAYKVYYQVSWEGHNMGGTEEFCQWVVPYLGAIKYQHAESTEELTSFSIGGGTVTESSDADDDGLKDYQEFIFCGTDSENPDTDGDLLDDKYECDHIPCCDPRNSLADMNLDGDFNASDINMFRNSFMARDERANCNCDDLINAKDINDFRNAYMAAQK